MEPLLNVAMVTAAEHDHNHWTAIDQKNDKTNEKVESVEWTFQV